MFKIPNTDRIFNQPNNSDVNGNIYATKNISFDEEGYLKLSDGVYKVTSSDEDFEDVDSMFKSDIGVFMLSDDLFRFSRAEIGTTITNVTTADSAPTPGVEDDGIFFNDTEVVSDGGTAYWNDDGTWTEITGTSLPTGATPTCMEVFDEKNSIMIGKGNEVAIVNSSWTAGTNLVLPADYMVTSLLAIGATAYVATRHEANGDAKLFLWDGAGADANAAYSVGTFELSTIKSYQSAPAGVDSLGRFIRFNGGGFDIIASFHPYYTSYEWADAQNEYSILSNRGMAVDGDIVYFNITPTLEDNKNRYLPNVPGGLWCYDPKIGLYHRNSQTKTFFTLDSTQSGDVNTTTDVITLTTAPATGEILYYDQGSLTIGGLPDHTFYFAINVSSTTIKLAKTYADAIAGNAIDLTSVSGSNGNFYIMTRNDWGDSYTRNRTSVLVLNSNLFNSDNAQRIIYANAIENKSATDDYGISVMQPLIEARGYFVTPKMFSPNIEDSFNTITLRYRPLKQGDEIRIKYRNQDIKNTQINVAESGGGRITWTSTTTFTTALDWSEVEEGWEVEIIGGQGAGHIAHVSEISETSGTYTVTLDDACSVVANTDKARAIAQNWTYLDTIDYTYDKNWKSIPVDQPSSWIQVKVELRGRGVTIEELRVDSREQQVAR
jgi:hypothetical protein